jgi:predicted CopG family antitoxin
MEKTTIQISSETLERLKILKRYDRESYDELLNNLINEVQKETLTDEEIEDIKIALDNVKKGKVKPIEQVAKELGITLN